MREFAKITRTLIEIVWALWRCLVTSLCFRGEQNVGNAGNRRYRLPELKSWLCIVFVMACLLTNVSAQAQEPNEVLILVSYHPTMVWTKSVVDTIEFELLRSGTDVEIHTEYMDTKHFSDRNHYTNLYTLFKNKAKREQYDVIITVDNNALLFLLRYRDELYPNVPIVFCGVDRYHGSMYERRPSETTIEEILGGHDSVTGVLEEFDYERTIEVALQLHPSARRVILINDGINEVTYYPNLSEEDVTNLAERFAGRAEFENLLLTESNLDQVIEKIRQRREESVVLLTNTFLDIEANLSLLRGKFRTFCRRCDAPVYAVDGSLLELGHLMGGYINRGNAQGKTAADMALQILSGESTGNIPIITKSPNKYIFRHPQMKKFGISPADLPPGSIILNQPESFYYKYRGRIWTVIAIVAVLALVVVILSVNILRRKAAEGSLRESEEKFRSIYAESPIAIELFDSEGHLLDANKASLDIFGVADVAEVKGFKLFEDPNLPDEAKEKLRKGEVAKFEASFDFEKVKKAKLYRTTKSGLIYLDVVITPLGVKGREPLVGYLIQLQDITEHKRAEGTLRESENKYRTLLENLPQKIFLKDRNSVYLSCNENLAVDLKIKSEEIAGKTDYDFFPKELAEKYRADDKRLMESGKVEDIEEKYIHEGRDVIVRTVKTPVKDEQGNVIGILGIFWDITERKRAEKALRESEEKFRTFMETASDLMHIADKDAYFTYVNESTLVTLGYSKEEMLGMHITDILSEGTKKDFEPRLKKLIEEGEIRADSVWVTKEGKEICGEITLVAVYDSDGEFAGARAIFRDITERKRAEEALQKARDELEIRVEQRTAELARANEQLLSLASELSLAEERLRRRIATDVHDHIGQNLAISKIKLESLRKSASSTELATSLDEVCELIGQTIESSRSLTFELSPPVLYELGFEAAVEWLVRRTREKHGLSAEFKSDGRSKPLSHDVSVLLFQAVRELLLNVAKHANARNVTVRSRRVADEIQVTVEDDGVGFDTSKTTSRDYETSGFGLFSIRERLRSIGGRFDIESRPGVGTRVTLAAHVDNGNEDSEEKRK